jgi:hypothetical protein
LLPKHENRPYASKIFFNKVGLDCFKCGYIHYKYLEVMME